MFVNIIKIDFFLREKDDFRNTMGDSSSWCFKDQYSMNSKIQKFKKILINKNC